MADYASRRGQSAASMWPQLTAAQQGVFLTLTHRLSLYNRMFFSLTPPLHDAFINRSFDDVWGGRSWKPSGDIAGPHGPFDASNETEYGRATRRTR